MGIVLVIAILTTGALFGLGFALLDRGDDMERRLAELERAPADDNQRGGKIVRSLVDEKERAALSTRFAEAGWYSTTIVSFTMWRISLAIGLGALLALFGQLNHLTLVTMGLMSGGGLAFGFVLPSFVLDSASRRRKSEIARRLPDFLDIVSTTVEAGTALNGALAIAVTRMQGALADEFRMTLSDIRVGMSRTDALTAMARRVKHIDLSSLVTALVQTERLGGNIAHLLDELAEETRNRRIARAEELAAKIPVKMVVPMAFFMLPALLVMIFGPVAAQLLNQ
ncbi:MAG TPA: type II secretion system F family protein [Candidatus Elarobacter sp.]|jgi:tight adherence protein C